MRSHWLRDIGRSGPLTADCLCGSDVLNLEALDAEGISLVPSNPLSPGGDSLNGGTWYWSPLSSFILIVLSLIILEGDGMARMGAFAQQFREDDQKKVILYLNWMKATYDFI